MLVVTPLQADPQMDDQAFRAAQWALATSTGQALAQLGPRLSAGNDELGALVRSYQDALEAWRHTSQQLRNALVGIDTVDEADLRAHLAALQRRVDRLQARLDAQFPLYRDLTEPQPLGISEVQGLLHPGEALLVSLVSRAATDLWLITPTHARWHRAQLGHRTLRQWIRQLRNDLAPLDGEPPERFDRNIAYQLYQTLIAPFSEQLAGIDHLLYVPDGPLTSLPLSLLVTAPPEAADDDLEALRETKWLLRHYAFSQLPTVSNLRTLRNLTPRRQRTEPFRGYGAPALQGSSVDSSQRGVELRGLYRGGRANLKQLHNLTPLPQTRIELLRLADALQAAPESVITGVAATETQVRSADLAHIEVIAFATHGVVAGELDGVAEPALVLTPPNQVSASDDGLITASEAARLQLDADWVVLSACNTAAPDGTPGADGLSGLARAFLFAGARAVLASHWPVRDDAAAALTSGTFTALAKDPSLTRAEALRQSMLAVIESPLDPSLAHPEAWAPFVIIGEGGR